MSNVDKFKSQSVAVIGRLTKMHESCYAAKLTSVNCIGMEVVYDEVQEQSATKLMNSFIDHHTVWSKILDRDEKFIMEELPKLYESDKFDSKTLVISLKCYNQLKSTGKLTTKSPVTETDEKAVWLHFKNMVTLACRHVAENKSKFPKVNVDVYTSKYGIKL